MIREMAGGGIGRPHHLHARSCMCNPMQAALTDPPLAPAMCACARSYVFDPVDVEAEMEVTARVRKVEDRAVGRQPSSQLCVWGLCRRRRWQVAA